MHIKIFVLVQLAALAAAQGTQFITGPCTSDADCASGCCGFNTGKCAGPVIALERDGGCGFSGEQQQSQTSDASTAISTSVAPEISTETLVPSSTGAPATSLEAPASSASITTSVGGDGIAGPTGTATVSPTQFTGGAATNTRFGARVVAMLAVFMFAL